ncbi:hypothetical protein EAS1808013_006390 [Enterobacter asburiae]|nr:hypothetical protein EAS1808013_006390 [Enterobacter asburiae]
MKRILSQRGLLLIISLWHLFRMDLFSFYESIQMMG